jgi:hypothetical protein
VWFPEKQHTCVILGFRREVDENCALLGHYAASSGPLLMRNDPEERSSKQYTFLKIILKVRKGRKLKYK